MASKSAAISQAKATQLLKAAKAAGFCHARLTTYPDGRIEIIGGNVPLAEPDFSLSPFHKWKSQHES